MNPQHKIKELESDKSDYLMMTIFLALAFFITLAFLNNDVNNIKSLQSQLSECEAKLPAQERVLNFRIYETLEIKEIEKKVKYYCKGLILKEGEEYDINDYIKDGTCVPKENLE